MKNFKYTILTFIISSAIVLGSIISMNLILDKKEENMLSEKNKISVESPIQSWNSGPDSYTGGEIKNSSNQNFLTNDQIKMSISNWNEYSDKIIHDPVDGQISMEEAVKKSTEWLETMRKNIVIDPEKENDIYSVRAILRASNQYYDSERKMEPYDSYWTVYLIGNEQKSSLYINAVTGNVWYAEILMYDNVDKNIKMDSLYTFAELSGINKNIGAGVREKYSAVIDLGDGLAAEMLCYPQAYDSYEAQSSFSENIMSEDDYYDIWQSESEPLYYIYYQIKVSN